VTALVTINQGTAPAGSDGDTVRSAFTKVNANVAVLQTQAALTSATGITTAQSLTVAHVGKRVNISLASAGVINLPAASTCAADSVILLRNIGTTVVTLAITAGSGDTVALSKLNPGEAVLMDTDGGHAWNVLTRGRSNSDNEIVIGNCTVNGNETVGGTLSVTGVATFSGGLAPTTTTTPPTTDSSGSLATTANVDAKIAARKVGRTLLQTKTTQGNTLLSMVNVAGYNVYELTLTDVVPATNSAAMSMQLSGDNGATWVATTNAYRYVLNSAGSAPSGPSTIAAQATAINLCSSLGNSSTGMFMSGSIRFYGLGRSIRAKGISWDLTCVLSDGNLYRISGAGELQVSIAPLNGILIAGGFNDGVWSLYGMDS
jgi:hypothetical protein